MNVLITGGTGFLGTHLTRVLRQEWPHARALSLPGPGKGGWDLSAAPLSDVLAPYRYGHFGLCFHLAGHNGGIAMNASSPAEVFRVNTQMALGVLEGCRRAGVGKVVCLAASCAYPGHLHHLEEKDFFSGPPHESVACHAHAKRNAQLACSLYAKQYGVKAVCLCPTTLYGPGDRFGPHRAKVVAATVARVVDARRKGAASVTVWGTGAPRREFLYAPDAARLLLRAALAYDDPDLPLNLGSGQELSVADLTRLVAKVAGYEGEVRFDPSRPDGAPRKLLDRTRQEALLGEFPFTPLQEGLRQTVKYYEENCP